MCLVLGSLHRNCSSSYLPHTPLFPVFTLERALDWALRQLALSPASDQRWANPCGSTFTKWGRWAGGYLSWLFVLSSVRFPSFSCVPCCILLPRPALHLFSSCCSDVLGGNRKPEAEVQVSWHVRQLSIQDLLEGSSRVPGHRGSIEGAVEQSHLHRYPQPQFWSLPAPPTSSSPLRRASLLWEVSRLLWAGSCGRLTRH